MFYCNLSFKPTEVHHKRRQTERHQEHQPGPFFYYLCVFIILLYYVNNLSTLKCIFVFNLLIILFEYLSLAVYY